MAGHVATALCHWTQSKRSVDGQMLPRLAGSETPGSTGAGAAICRSQGMQGRSANLRRGDIAEALTYTPRGYNLVAPERLSPSAGTYTVMV